MYPPFSQVIQGEITLFQKADFGKLWLVYSNSLKEVCVTSLGQRRERKSVLLFFIVEEKTVARGQL